MIYVFSYFSLYILMWILEVDHSMSFVWYNNKKLCLNVINLIKKFKKPVEGLKLCSS